MFETVVLAEHIVWDEHGLAPAIVQNATTSEVLMLAWMNHEAFTLTDSTRIVHFWSRSRQELWEKGATSGNRLRVIDLTLDCDRDAILVKALPGGPTCHLERRSCFGASDSASPQGLADLEALWSTVTDRIRTCRPESYTALLAGGGATTTGRKVIEEAAELVEAALAHQRGDADDQRLSEEAADLVFHLFVLLGERHVSPSQFVDELRSRRRPRGHPHI